MSALRDKTVLVGVSGGIAAYKTCALVSKLVQSGANVHVVMTENATKFVSPMTFESLSHNRVTVDTFDRNFAWETEHVALAKKAELVVIAPATANVIAKLACGIADDFLTTTVLACGCKLMIAPAMNTAMLENVATRTNIKTLEARGADIIFGTNGYLACGDVGGGRMAEPDVLFDRIGRFFSPATDLKDKTVLVTSGATRTVIDPVRFITNRSSGKMGYAIARAASRRGANVIYVKGHTSTADVDPEWKTVEVNSTAEMLEAVKANHQDADVFVMAAAPCDYDVVPSKNKIKSASLTLELKKAPDIAAWVGANKANKFLAVFAAETDNCVANAEKKLESKNADLVVLNDVTKDGAGFDVDTNVVTLIDKSGKQSLPKMTKSELADIILDKITK